MQQEITISVSDLFRFILRGLIPSVLVAGIVGFGVYQLSQSRNFVYEAQSTVLAAQSVPNRSSFGSSVYAAPPLDASAYRAAIISDSVVADAIVRLDPSITEIDARSIKRLRGKTNVRTEEDKSSSLIYIKVQDSTAQGAVNKANAVAQAVVNWDKDRAKESLDQQIAGLEAQIAAISEQIRALQTSPNAPQDQINGLIQRRAEIQENLAYTRVLSASAVGLLSVLQPAPLPSRPVAPRPVFEATLAALLGIFLTYGLLLLRNSLDTRLRTVEDIAAVSGLPVIAEFPRLTKGVRNLPREASSYLRTNLLFSTADANPKVILVASAQSEEGKSSISISLAESFVRNGYRTLLIDADLRKPIVAGEYRINNIHQPSLEDCLKNPYSAQQAASVSIGAKDFLYVIPTFQPTAQASELLSKGFRECLERWRQEYDVIIIDSSPLLAVADALTIAPLCTGTLLAINQQKTDRRQLRSALELLNRIGVRVLGAAVTHVNKESGQKASYGYGYGASEVVDPKTTLIDSPVISSRVKSR